MTEINKRSCENLTISLLANEMRTAPEPRRTEAALALIDAGDTVLSVAPLEAQGVFRQAGEIALAYIRRRDAARAAAELARQ